jgi:glyoxylase-like metal-dependent hydrolase (beta-lactamase superfamily II)
VFTGDAVGITYPAYPVLVPTTPPTSFNLEAAIASLRRIKEVSPKRLATPHYGVIHDAVGSIDANIRSLQEWASEINKMLRGGLSTNSIITALTEAIAREKVQPGASLPDYLQMSIRVSVLGMLRYLGPSGKNAAR